MRRLAFIPLLVIVLSLMSVGPAHADPDFLKISFDREEGYADQLDGPLWQGSARMAPTVGMDSRTFFIKNDSNQTAKATLGLTDISGDLADFVDFTITFVGSNGTSVTNGVAVQPDGKKCRTFATRPVIPAGGIQEAFVTATLVDLDNQDHQDESAEVDFRLALSQVIRNDKTDPCGNVKTEVAGAQATKPTAGTPMSAERGAGTVLGWTVLGVILAGLLVAARQRRRRI